MFLDAFFSWDSRSFNAFRFVYDSRIIRGKYPSPFKKNKAKDFTKIIVKIIKNLNLKFIDWSPKPIKFHLKI